jgi:L,D-transpeptidase ErfK/SrfK
MLTIRAPLWFQEAIGEEFVLPSNSQDTVVGKLLHTYASDDDTLLDIARRFDIGHDQIIAANPSVNRWIPGIHTTLIIPSLYVVPARGTSKIIINLAEFRLYFFPATTNTVVTFPVGIGAYNWQTPLGKTQIIKKVVAPAWHPPLSIRKEYEQNGEILPPRIPPDDPQNPLGDFALYLGIPGYLIHGTTPGKAFGVGMRVSHGCIRMYPEDMRELFKRVHIGTTVSIIDQPIKVGRRGKNIYLEYHKSQKDPFDNPLPISEPSLSGFLLHLASFNLEISQLSTQKAREVYRRGDGIPTNISIEEY